MAENEIQNKVLEAVMTSGPSALLASIGWVAHTLATANRIPEWHKLAGGAMLAGFVGWVGVVVLTHLFKMDPQLAATFAAIIGSSGERGYKYFRELSEKRDEVSNDH